MKKIFLKPFLCALFAIASTFNLVAQNIAINETNFPDENFRQFLTQKVSGGADGVFTPAEISNIKSMEINHSLYAVEKRMTSIKGIEFFTALTSLSLYSLEALTSADVRGLTNLTSFDASICRNMVSLNVSGLTNLTSIKVYGCYKLTSLDLSNLTSLSKVDCRNNSILESINLDGCTSITSLDASYNILRSIDVSQLTNLSFLNVMQNKLSSIDVSNNTKLTSLYCAANPLTTLDISNNTLLGTLDCSQCGLTALDLSNNTRLSEIGCLDNAISSLDVSNQRNLSKLNCGLNRLTSLDLSNNRSLTELRLSSNPIDTLDISNNTALTTLHIHGCGTPEKMLEIDLSNHYITDFRFGTEVYLDAIICGPNRNKLAIEIPTTESLNLRHSEIVVEPTYYVVLGSYDKNRGYYNNTKVETSEAEIITIGDKNYYVFATIPSGKDFTVINKLAHGATGEKHIAAMDFQLKYLSHSERTPDNIKNKTFYTRGKIQGFHLLYLNPLSIQNNREGVYTGTLYLDEPTIIPSDCGLKVYSATAITKESEEEGRLILQEQNDRILPKNSGVVVTASEPGFQIFSHNVWTGNGDITEYTLVKTQSFIIEDPDPFPSNILEGTYSSDGLSVVPYSVLTLGRRTDNGSQMIGFWNYKGNKINQYRCYIPTDKIPSAMMSPKLQGLSFQFPGEFDLPTSIDAAPVDNGSIDTHRACYDLQGRRVSHPQRGGVYIINGKKVIF